MINIKILIVDDSPEDLDFINSSLIEFNRNFRIVQGMNIKVGMKLALKYLPDLIITDWEMSDGDGIEFINNLKANPKTRDIPIVMATGKMTSSENLKTALDAGAVDYIRKPIDKVELEARIQSTLKMADYYQQLVETKNKELTSNALFLVKNNEFNTSLIKKLKEIGQYANDKNVKINKHLQQIVNDIDTKVREDSWDRFELYFQEVHHNFFDKLLYKYPDLTPNELRLCAFIRLGMSSKDIASITFRTPDSIKVYRSRVRKKLNININENLTNFLHQF